jgi:cytochrome c oxidase subunit III
MIWFLIAGITSLFFTLMVLFAFSNPAMHLGGQHYPKAFIISTVVIIACSFTIERAKWAFKKEDGKKLADMLLITFALTTVFGVLQYWGWMQLWDSGVTLYGVGEGMEGKTPSGAFLYVISGLHAMHLLGGLIFLYLTIVKVIHARSDEVKRLVYFSDGLERARVEMLAKYWHFLGGLWCILFLYFLWFFV